MNYWLLKSEPSVWSFNDQKKSGSKGTVWDGVRNYQAANYLKQMKSGDLCFFYHSNEDKKVFVISGGVASNKSIRNNLDKLSKEIGFENFFPPIELCSDNGAMIAWAGIERFKKGMEDNLEVLAKPRWPLDPDAPFLKGAGVKY